MLKEARVMGVDSPFMDPFADVMKVKRTSNVAEAIGLGTIKEVIGALKRVSEENKELKSEINRLRRAQVVVRHVESVPEKREAVSVEAAPRVDGKRKLGWKPID